MKKTPAISIIMSVYNGEDYVEEAIQSVCNQSFTDWELIVINDCSGDATASILETLSQKDERIKVHPNEVNLGLQKSLNKALFLATGKYLARMDADDICLPDRFEKQFQFMEAHRELALSSCKFMTLKNGAIAPGGCGGRCDFESIKARLLVTNPILHPGVIAKTDVMQKLTYDAGLTCTEDLELWIRFVREGYKMEILPEYLMLYRLHDKQITSTTRERQHREVLGVQRQYFEETLNAMSEEQEAYYIGGVYFRDAINIDSFCALHRWMKTENKKKKFFTADALAYAMFEILAEYKRHGITKKQLLQAMASFDICFLVRELGARKKRARIDAKKCIAAAEAFGLTRAGGTKEFPLFTQTK